MVDSKRWKRQLCGVVAQVTVAGVGQCCGSSFSFVTGMMVLLKGGDRF